MAPKKEKKQIIRHEPDATSEEVVRQQRVAAKAELTSRMEEETKISKVNGLKILNQWRKLMRIAKTESLKNDVEILSKTHERDVSRKDAILHMLDRDLEEAEEQFQTAMRSHMMNIDVLIDLHDSRMQALEKNFHSDLEILQSSFNEEKSEMTARYKVEKKQLAAIIETIEKEEQDRESEAKHAFEQLREEIRNRNAEDINMLRISLDAQIEELEALFETAHSNYLQQTAQRTHDFKELTLNDQKLTGDIDKMRKKIDTLQTNVQQWRSKIKQLSRETEERNRLLLEEKRSIQKHYQLLKQRIEIYRGVQNQGLLHLSQSANKCKAVLQEHLQLARRVVHLNELSRRLETVQEQVLPFGHGQIQDGHSLIIASGLDNSDPTSHAAHDNDEGRADREEELGSIRVVPLSQSPVSNSQSPAVAPVVTIGCAPSITAALMANLNPHGSVPPVYQSSLWAAVPRQHRDEEAQADDNEGAGEELIFVAASERMANFHMKYNQVVLDNIAIDKEKERLSYENAQLQDLISQYIDGTRLTADVLDDDNPLFVINGRANLNSVPPVRRIATTIQDGNVIMNTPGRQR